MIPRLSIAIVAALLFLVLASGIAYASPNNPQHVPEASALILAPFGIAAIVAAEHKRRKLAKLRKGVGKAYFLVKRSVDILLAAAALLISFPLLALIALMVRLDSPGPILFRRRVVGLNEKRFDMFKFRSMVEGAEQILEESEDLKKLYYVKCKLDEDPRITKLGALLRRTSLDELPQLINIFLGDMTFVGPRPIAPDEVEKYGPCFDRFVKVKPGVTGLWQTCGRSETSYEKRVEMDMLYIEQRSILLDLWIIVSTVPAVVLKRGAC